MHTPGDSLLRQVASTFGTRLLLVAISLITSVLIARSLGPEGRGMYAVAATIGALGVQFMDLGLHASNTFYVARDPTLLPRLLGNSLWAATLAGGLGSALAWCLFAGWPSIAPLGEPLLTLALAWIPLGLMLLHIQNLLLGLQQVTKYNQLDLLFRILSTLLMVAAAILAPASTEALFLAAFAALAMSVAWGLSKLIARLASPIQTDWELLKRHLPYGLKAYLAALFGYLALKADLMMVQYLRGPAETGFYATAVSMADFILILPTILGTLLFPKLTAMQDPKARQEIVRRVCTQLSVALGLMLAGLGLLAEPLITFLYGHDYTPAAQALLLQLPGIWCIGMQVILARYLAAVGLPISIVAVWLLALLFNLALNWVMVTNWGFLGAAVTYSVSQLLVLISVTVLFLRHVRSTANP